jgi:RimJ/RimL family protein N-acetyltransferase
MGRLPLLAEPLTGQGVRLRDSAERDIPEILIAHEDDPSLHRRLGQARPPSGAQLGRLAETEATDRAAGSRAALTILSPDSDLCLGQVTVHHVDWEHTRADISIWVAPQVRARGLGSGALDLAARWLLGPCGLDRVQLLVEHDNEPMLRAAARTGFVAEGVLHGYVRTRNRRGDVTILSLLPTDLAVV